MVEKRAVRIHYVVPFFHPVIGGVETRVRELGRRLVGRGHSVTVHCMARTLDGRRLPLRDRLEGILIERRPPLLHRGGYLLLYLPRLSAGDVADVHGYPFLTGDCLRVTRGRRLALVHTPLGAPLRPATARGRALKRLYDTFLGLPTLRRARRVVVMTGDEADWLAARGIPLERIVEVANGVREEGFGSWDAGFARARWGFDRYVLFLGRLHQDKRPVDLVEALALLGGEYPRLAAVFAGPDQGEAARVRRCAARLGLQDRVVLAGPVREDEKWCLIAGCEALALPSTWEAQGIALLEAWAQGRPVVATSVGGVPRVVEHGRTGLLVPLARPAALADALRLLLEDPALAQTIGAAGRAEAHAKYRWDAVAERLEAVYTEATA